MASVNIQICFTHKACRGQIGHSLSGAISSAPFWITWWNRSQAEARGTSQHLVIEKKSGFKLNKLEGARRGPGISSCRKRSSQY